MATQEREKAGTRHEPVRVLLFSASPFDYAGIMKASRAGQIADEDARDARGTARVAEPWSRLIARHEPVRSVCEAGFPGRDIMRHRLRHRRAISDLMWSDRRCLPQNCAFAEPE